MIIENAAGNCSFIRGIGPFSAGVRASAGYTIVHARFHPSVPLAKGYDLIEQELRKANRPINALCGIQLRVPKPFSRAGFDEFNRPYIEKLRGWGLEVQGANPVTRTNVTYEVNAVSEPVIAGFFYTVSSANARPTWIISGVPEIASRDGAVQIVAANDTSLEGLRQKTECVLQIISRHIAELGVSWSQATTVNLYAIHDLHPLLTSTILPAIGDASQVGVTWHHARPPVSGLEIEIDAWSVAREDIVGNQG